jgi:hypothetical protein
MTIVHQPLFISTAICIHEKAISNEVNVMNPDMSVARVMITDCHLPGRLSATRKMTLTKERHPHLTIQLKSTRHGSAHFRS